MRIAKRPIFPLASLFLFDAAHFRNPALYGALR
jgi:hypothetical protein